MCAALLFLGPASGQPTPKRAASSARPHSQLQNSRSADAPGRNIEPTTTPNIISWQLTTTANPFGGGAIAANPSSPNGFYTAGTSVQLTAVPATGYQFSFFGGDLSGITNPQSITMNATHNVTASFATIPAGFTDVSPSDFFYDAANLMWARHITAGCSSSPFQFCPNATVTRAEAAIFIVRAALGGDSFTYSSTPHFGDVPAGAFGFAWIQKMYELGITAGCGVGAYCPNDPVTRGQMAIFVTRARLGAAADGTFTYPSTPYFTDVLAGNPSFKWIQRMKVDGITAGCGATTYCPNDPVTRGQMAIFIIRGAFNQLLTAGTPLVSQISPPSGAAQTLTGVTITGLNTHFLSSTPTVSAGPGIVVSNIFASTDTSLTALFTIDTAAQPGPRTILVKTGTEEAILPNGFLVSQPANVDIMNAMFNPDPVNASAGGFIRWTNQDAAQHHIRANDGTFDTGVLSLHQAGTVSSPAVGSHTYHCEIHPSEIGTVVVN